MLFFFVSVQRHIFFHDPSNPEFEAVYRVSTVKVFMKSILRAMIEIDFFFITNRSLSEYY